MRRFALFLLLMLVLSACTTTSTTAMSTPIEQAEAQRENTPITLPSPKATYSTLSTITATSEPLVETTVTDISNMSQHFRTNDYLLKSTIQLEDWTIISWELSSNEHKWGRNRVTISVMYQTVMIDNAVLGQLPQEDITGEGHPDVMLYIPERVWKYVMIYNLGDFITFDKITRVYFDSIPRDCKFEIKDLNNDDISEIINCDFAFGFFDCGPSWGPMPLTISTYDSISMQYNVVSPLYPEIYTETIQTLTELSEQSPEDKCLISGLLMNYFYSGQTEMGWSEMHRIYEGDDIDDFQKEMEELLETKRKAGRYVLLEDLENE